MKKLSITGTFHRGEKGGAFSDQLYWPSHSIKEPGFPMLKWVREHYQKHITIG